MGNYETVNRRPCLGIAGVPLVEHVLLYTVYADDLQTHFFLQLFVQLLVQGGDSELGRGGTAQLRAGRV